MTRLRFIGPIIAGCAAVFVTVVLCSSSMAADRTNADGSPATLNYAFATQLGSGIYRINDRTIQVYRISGPITLRQPAVGHWGLLLRVPVTFGFYNFKLEDVIDSGLPESLGSLAIIPTLEFEFHAREMWWIGPFLGLGGGKDFSGGEFNFIYATGVRNNVLWPGESVDIRMGNRLIYTGYTNSSMDFVDDFAFLENGFDFRRGLGFSIGGFDVDGSLFAASYIYFMSPNVVNLIPEPVEIRTEWELGMTFGTEEPLTILGLRMPRLGVSYRFGTGMDAVRIIIGNPFPIDTPADKGPAVN